jgi:hypothetical protein
MARGEVTGKKPTATDDGPKYRRKPKSVDPNALALSIHAFCVLHDISEDQFYKMQREGWGPTTMKVGSRTLISAEAAAEWRREREADRRDEPEEHAPSHT